MEQIKNNNCIIGQLYGWELIRSYDFVEIWKTNTSYLVCYKYGHLYKFCGSLDEAKRIVPKIVDRLKKEPKLI